MTVVINYTSKVVTLTLSDKRGIYYEDGIMKRTDQEEKLVNLNYLSWASGAGYAIFLDNAKMNMKTATNEKELLYWFNRTIEEAEKRVPDDIQDVYSSTVCVSFRDDYEETFKLGYMCKQLYGNRIHYIEPNKFDLLYPSDLLNNHVLYMNFLLRNNLYHEYKDLPTLVKRSLELFSEILKYSNVISSTCDIGIHFMNEAGIFKVKLSGEVDELKNLFEKIEIIDKTIFNQG